MSSEAGTKCPSCGELAVHSQSGDVDCRAQCVCEACGLVVEDSSLVHYQPFAESGQASGFSGDYISLPNRFYVRNNVSKPKILGMRKVSEMGQVLRFTAPMIEEARLMFERVYQSGRIMHLKAHVKETVAIACLYIVGRLHSWPIAISCIANTGQRLLKEVVYWVRIVKQLLDIEITTPDIEELVPVQIREWGLPESLKTTAISIIQLLKSTWAVEGQPTRAVVKASIFVAYDAHRCKEGCRKVLSLPKFSAELKVKSAFPKSTMKLVTKTMQLLLDLGSNVPWLDSDLTKLGLLHHMDDVLAYQKTLLHDAIRDYKLSHQDSDDDPDMDKCDTTTPVEAKTCTTKAPGDLSGEEKGDSTAREADNQDQNLTNNRKRKIPEDIFTPLCYRINRQKSREAALKPVPKEKPFIYLGDLNSTELCEHDLTERELKEYLRDEEQVKVLDKLSPCK